jgi:hypothetical protein
MGAAAFAVYGSAADLLPPVGYRAAFCRKLLSEWELFEHFQTAWGNSLEQRTN